MADGKKGRTETEGGGGCMETEREDRAEIERKKDWTASEGTPERTSLNSVSRAFSAS